MPTLQRYVSNELTHFVGGNLNRSEEERLSEEEQYKLLIKILTSGWLTHPPHDPRKGTQNLSVNISGRVSKNEMFDPQVICFCDIPVSDLEIHMNKYSRFGLSFRKQFLIQRGANPVFYVAKNSMIRDWNQFDDNAHKEAMKHSPSPPLEDSFKQIPRSELFDKMCGTLMASQNPRQRTLNLPLELQKFLFGHIFGFFKFFDAGTLEDDPENFYMEREWRIWGNLKFELEDVYRIILPASYATRLREEVPNHTGQITFVE